MKQRDRKPKQSSFRPTRFGTLVAALLCIGLLGAVPASANYEQVDTFAGTPGELHNSSEESKWPEEVQLAGVSGMAVNYTGAGGVTRGTLYAITSLSGANFGVARYNPDGSFSERWTFMGDPPSERCGPDGDPLHPKCVSRPSANTANADVEVDESTGYVYVLATSRSVGELEDGMNAVHIYSADGSKLIGEFGVLGKSVGEIGSHPEQIHRTREGGLAIGPGGNVYVQDSFTSEGANKSRLMTFEPQSPGDYEHYVYAGQSHDFEAGFGAEGLGSPVADAAGDLYVTAGINGNSIAKFDPSQLAAPHLCDFSFPKGQIKSIAVNPANGEVFFYSRTDRKIHRLTLCNGGEFTDAGSFGFAPKRRNLTAMAFDPTRQFGPGRPAGTLYAGAPSGEEGKTEGEYPDTKGESSLGYVFAPPVELPPEVKSESVEHVTSTTADLLAQINPKGPPTNYAFQYIAEADYEANEPADRFAGAAESPLGGALLGEGPDTLSAATSLTELHADTTYHYRALARNHCSEELPEKVCEDAGADEVFHTFPVEAPGLPDKRVYELVSPPQKQGGQVLPGDPEISSCGSCKPGTLYTYFPMRSRLDGEAIVYEGTPFASGQGAVRLNQYIARRDAKAGWQTVNLTPPTLFGSYLAFSPSFGQGVLSQNNGAPTLSPEAPPEFKNLYIQPSENPLALAPLLTAEPPNRQPTDGTLVFKLTYAGASADLSRIFFAVNDALTEETPFAPEALDGGASKNNLYEWAGGQLRLVNVMPGNAETHPGASFGALSANAISTDGSLAFFSDEAGNAYVREDGETTRAIPGPGKFLSASVDGSKVLLTSGSIYDLASETSVDLTEGQGGFEGIAGQSEDLSHVYFVDSKVLSGEEENSEGAKAQAGKDNLYAWVQGGTMRFVATLVASDNVGSKLGNTWSPLPSTRTAEASLSGRFLAFLSQAQLTAYDNAGFPEAFLYDSATGELTCASCNPSGTRPLGMSVLRLFREGEKFPQPRYLTDEGRLYFDSRDSLTPFDTNNGVEDVYQYEPDGVGSCEHEGGCVTLISAGSEPIDSNFLAIDEDGGNVFFTSRDQLVLKDHDDLIDLYDARENGGIPAETEVARGECQGEACVPALTPPNDPTPGSSSFEGAGNVDEKKATKKHHKKKHAKKHKSHNRSHGRAAKHNRGGAK